MLGLMRKKAKSWMIKVILGAVVVVFVFWGVGTFRSRTAEVIATVNGIRINYKDYVRKYDDTVRYLQERLKDNFSNKTIKEMNLKQRVLDEIIEEVLLEQEADRRGIAISEDELQAAIVSNPWFQVNGIFSKEKYLRVLSLNHMTPIDFEDYLLRELKRQRLRNIITDSVKVSPQECFEAFAWDNEKVNIEFVKIDPANFEKDVKYTDDDLKAYFEKHKDEFKTPERRKVIYIRIKDEDFMDQVSVSDEEVKDFYELNLSKFTEPEQARARHILIKVDAKDSEKAKEEKLKLAEKILKEALTGADFAKLAEKYSQDTTTASKGGDLGFFTKKEVVKPFADAVFSAEAGKVVPRVVNTPVGYHIVKVEEIKEKKVRPLDEVKDEISKNLRTVKAQEKAYEFAEKADEKAYEMEDLEKAAKSLGLRTYVTEPFAKNEKPEGVERPDLFVKAAFELKEGETSNLVSAPSVHYIIELIEVIPPEVPEFYAVRGDVEERYLSEKTEKMARERAEEILKQLKAGKGSLTDLAAASGLKAEESGMFKRRGIPFIPKLGYSPEIKESAFDLSKERPVPEKIFKAGKYFVVFQLKEKKSATKAEFEKEKGRYMQELLATKRQEIYNRWLESVKNRAEIHINRKLL